MSVVSEVWKWAARNRKVIGGGVLMLGGWLATMGPDWDAWSKMIIALGGIVAGSGVASSDAQVKAKQKFEDQGVEDRRAH